VTKLHVLLLMDVALAALVSVDLARTLRTGRARSRLGTITREMRPERFWRYIYASHVVLAACAGLFLRIVIAPQTLCGDGSIRPTAVRRPPDPA